MAAAARRASPEAQVRGFIAKFSPANQRLLRALRARLRELFPTAWELIYDNYNFLVFAFCASERPSSSILSLAGDANGASLMFFRGADVPDPRRLLQGSGVQNRFIRLPSPEVLERPEVLALIRAASEQAPVQLPATGRGPTVVRMISPTQRPRRR